MRPCRKTLLAVSPRDVYGRSPPRVVAVSETRERIRAHVAANPGVHFRAIARDLDLAIGQVQYHVRRLCRADDLVREAHDGRTHFFTPDVDEPARRQLAVCRRETARDVLAVLAKRGPTPPATVADDLAVARSTLEYHLDGLVDAGLVEKRNDAGGLDLALTDDEIVARRLDAVAPTAPDRAVDRFARLVDGLLYDD